MVGAKSPGYTVVKTAHESLTRMGLMAVDSGGKATGAKIGTIFEVAGSCYGHCS